MEKTPAGGNNLTEETSAYRSYKKREMVKSKNFSLNNTESLEKFSNTVELVNKNKVNRTNAFENRVIDETGQIFVEIAKGGKIEAIWQKYSTGVDACGKIYGLCVDSVHSDVLSILQGLNRTGVIQEVDEENKQEAKKKSKKKVLGGANTLAADEAEISTTRFERFEDYDVYFKTISSKFDASNANGLLFNNICVSEGLDLVFATDHPMAECEKEPSVKIPMPVIDEENLFSLELGEKIQRFLKSPISNSQIADALMSMDKANEFIVGSESEETYIEESIEDPDPVFSEQFDGLEESALEGISESLAVRIKKLTENDDYKFFHQASAWAGFEYAKGIVGCSAKGTEKKPLKKKKEKEEDDFCLDVNFKLDKSDFFPQPKKSSSNTLSENVISKWKDSNIRLPEDFRFTLKRFTRLFTRPSTFVKSVKSVKGADSERKHVILESDLENSIDEGLFVKNEGFEFGDNEELQMKYSVKSKQVDIKKLKQTISDNLNKGVDTETFCGILDNLVENYSDAEIEQLSVHSCFITMLHLANENEFTLQKTGECDFRIIKNN